MDPITTWLMNQGPAGILAVAIVVLYKSNQAQARDHAAELRDLNKQHRAEMDVLVERHRITVNKLFDKVEALLARVGHQRRRRTGVVSVNAEGEET